MNDTNTETVTITRARYVELLEDEDFLSALRAAGVDNWDGYDYALEISQDVE